ncbi:hypothetical protein V9Z67_04770 [Streptococcus suis]|uniref:hypothetical protein n=1 Tax=Streptococcus suis TaxID=1307 RepID=UPI00301035F2
MSNIGDPLLAIAVALTAGKFFFKDRKPMYGVGTIIAGAGVYYVAHNIFTVFTTIEPVIKILIDFFTW